VCTIDEVLNESGFLLSRKSHMNRLGFPHCKIEREWRTYEVEFALAEISTGAAFLSDPPLIAAHAPSPVIPYTPKAMYSLRIFLPAIVLFHDGTRMLAESLE